MDKLYTVMSHVNSVQSLIKHSENNEPMRWDPDKDGRTHLFVDAPRHFRFGFTNELHAQFEGLAGLELVVGAEAVAVDARCHCRKQFGNTYILSDKNIAYFCYLHMALQNCMIYNMSYSIIDPFTRKTCVPRLAFVLTMCDGIDSSPAPASLTGTTRNS